MDPDNGDESKVNEGGGSDATNVESTENGEKKPEPVLVSQRILQNEYSATTYYIPPAKNSDQMPIIRTHITHLKPKKDTIAQVNIQNLIASQTVCPLHNRCKNSTPGTNTSSTETLSIPSEPSTETQTNSKPPRGSTEANRQRRQKEREHKMSRLKRQGKLRNEEPTPEPKPEMPNPLRRDSSDERSSSRKTFPTPDLYIYRTEILAPDLSTFVFDTCSRFPRCIFLKIPPLSCNCYCRVELSVANYRRFMMTEFQKRQRITRTSKQYVQPILPYLDLPDVFDDMQNRSLVRRKHVPPLKMNIYCKVEVGCMKPYILREPRPCGCYERTMALKFEVNRPKTGPKNDWESLMKVSAEILGTPKLDDPLQKELLAEVDETVNKLEAKLREEENGETLDGECLEKAESDLADYDDDDLNTDERADSSGQESYSRQINTRKIRKKKKGGKKRRK